MLFAVDETVVPENLRLVGTSVGEDVEDVHCVSRTTLKLEFREVVVIRTTEELEGEQLGIPLDVV